MRTLRPLVALILACAPLGAWACSPTGYPGTGQTMLSDFDTGAFLIRFHDDGCTASFWGVSGDAIGNNNTVEYAYTPMGAGVHKLTWVAFNPEKVVLANVVHVQNWNTCMVYTSFSRPDMTFVHWQGPQIRNWDSTSNSGACPGTAMSPPKGGDLAG